MKKTIFCKEGACLFRTSFIDYYYYYDDDEHYQVLCISHNVVVQSPGRYLVEGNNCVAALQFTLFQKFLASDLKGGRFTRVFMVYAGL